MIACRMPNRRSSTLHEGEVVLDVLHLLQATQAR
jgi:hypothetical protein